MPNEFNSLFFSTKKLFCKKKSFVKKIVKKSQEKIIIEFVGRHPVFCATNFWPLKIEIKLRPTYRLTYYIFIKQMYLKILILVILTIYEALHKRHFYQVFFSIVKCVWLNTRHTKSLFWSNAIMIGDLLHNIFNVFFWWKWLLKLKFTVFHPIGLI